MSKKEERINVCIPVSLTEGEINKILLSLSNVIACVHPFNEVVSGDKGDFCCKCQNYLNSHRL